MSTFVYNVHFSTKGEWKMLSFRTKWSGKSPIRKGVEIFSEKGVTSPLAHLFYPTHTVELSVTIFGGKSVCDHCHSLFFSNTVKGVNGTSMSYLLQQRPCSLLLIDTFCNSYKPSLSSHPTS